VAKRAAELSGEEPKVFRAIQPTALLARLSRDTTRRLEALEREVEALEARGAPDTVPFRGEPEFKSLLMRLAVRVESPVSVVAPADILQATVPVWRARTANDRPTVIVSVGRSDGDFPVPIDRTVDPAAVEERLGTVPTIVVTESAAILCHRDGEAIYGYWTSDAVLVAAARGTILAIHSG
jgi:sugar-specific transcriptional regulator TrmB